MASVDSVAEGDITATGNNMDLMEVWKLLPALRDLPEALLRKLQATAIFQLNMALAKDKKSSEKLSVNARLAQNAKKLLENPTQIAAGYDNSSGTKLSD